MTCRVILSITSILVVLTFSSYLQCVQSANILAYSIIGSHSTRISMWPMMEELTNRGHNVTFLSPFASYEESEKRSKVKSFIPKKWLEVLGSWDQQMGFYDIRKNNMLPFMWYGLRHMGVLSCEALYSDPEFMEWVMTSPKFDALIVEASANECAYGLVRLWNAKLIIYSTTTSLPWMVDQYAFPDESSSVSDTILNFPPWKEMSFLQRFVNAICPIVFSLTWEYEYLPKLEEITRKGLDITPKENEMLPGFLDVGASASLVLLTSHFSLDFPRSLPPHVIHVGGIAVTKKKKPLPQDMQEFINSKSGFIYIAFGTVADFTTFDEVVQQEFINALGNFSNINFVWVSSKDINNGILPANIFVSKWAPQQTLLAHPKIKAFITHSGMGSVVESVLNSVPVISIPVLAEQDFNANSIVNRGAGIKLEITTLKKEELTFAISEILHNPKYRLAMKYLTKVYNDRPIPPLENAIWWIEYILRHKNINTFIVPPSARQSWWKRRQIDVWISVSLILILTTILVTWSAIYLIRKLLAVLKATSETSTSHNRLSKNKEKLQ